MIALLVALLRTAVFALVALSLGVDAADVPPIPLGPIDVVAYPHILSVEGEIAPKMQIFAGYTSKSTGGTFALEPGPYRLVGTDAGGAVLFSQPFDQNVAIQYSSEVLFSIQVPLSEAVFASLKTLTVTAKHRSVSETSIATGPPMPRAAADGTGVVSITWNGDAYPEGIVEAADGSARIRATSATGTSTAFVRTALTSLTINFSNRVTSTTVVVPVQPAAPAP